MAGIKNLKTKSWFRFLTKALFYVAAVVYPVLIFYFLVIRKTPIRMLSLFVIAFALIAFITGTSKKKAKEDRSRCFGLPSFFFV